MALTLIEHGELFEPAPLGTQSLLLAFDRIARIGPVDRHALDALGLEVEVIDATGCVVAPGFIDPHEHLLGGSGEGAFSLQTPPVFIDEIVRAGVTTAVGLLGVDTTMTTPAGLLARARALIEQGLSAYLWTGGYNVPPTTVMPTVRDDLLFIAEVIGAGEIAISDERGLHPAREALAALVRDTHVGGLLAGKCGVTHFHVGEEASRLAPLRALVDDFAIPPRWLYPAHVQRNGALLDEAIALARRGSYVCLDVVERDLSRWVRHWRERGAPADRITVCSDADSSTPDILSLQLRQLATGDGIPLEEVLPMATSNVAAVLALPRKGRLAPGMDADVVVMERGSLAVRDVVARGRRMVADGAAVVRERFVETSARVWSLHGARAPDVV